MMDTEIHTVHNTNSISWIYVPNQSEIPNWFNEKILIINAKTFAKLEILSYLSYSLYKDLFIIQ